MKATEARAKLERIRDQLRELVNEAAEVCNAYDGHIIGLLEDVDEPPQYAQEAAFAMRDDEPDWEGLGEAIDVCFEPLEETTKNGERWEKRRARLG